MSMRAKCRVSSFFIIKLCVLQLLCQGMEGLVGFVVQELWNLVKDVKDRAKYFRPQLTELEKTLRDLVWIIEKIESIDAQLIESGQSEVNHLKSIMDKGKKLVPKCLRVSGWNFISKSHYEKELTKLDSEITKFNNKYTELLILEVKELRSQLSKLSNEDQSRIGTSSTCSSTGATSSGRSLTSSAAEATTGRSGPIYPLDHSDLNLSHPSPLVHPPISQVPSTFVPPPVPTRAASIGFAGLISLIIIPGVNVILRITAIVIIICKSMTVIISMLEKSDSEIWMVINDVGMFETTRQQLDVTLESLDRVLKGIKSISEAAESLKSLLEEGKKLVRESTNIGWWDFVEKLQHQKKMVESDNKLLKFHSLYLQARLSKNNDKTDDDSEMKDDDESFVPIYYDEDRPDETEGGHMLDTREHESYRESYRVMLPKNEPHPFTPPKNLPISSSTRRSQQYALGSSNYRRKV